MSGDKSSLVRALNDHFRRTFSGGNIVMTPSIRALPEDTFAKVLSAIRTFNAFTKDNDPHGEHDFVSIEVDGHKVFAKIDYYDLSLSRHSEDPTNPQVTARIMTVMLAEE